CRVFTTCAGKWVSIHCRSHADQSQAHRIIDTRGAGRAELPIAWVRLKLRVAMVGDVSYPVHCRCRNAIHLAVVWQADDQGRTTWGPLLIDIGHVTNPVLEFLSKRS